MVQAIIYISSAFILNTQFITFFLSKLIIKSLKNTITTCLNQLKILKSLKKSTTKTCLKQLKILTLLKKLRSNLFKTIKKY